MVHGVTQVPQTQPSILPGTPEQIIAFKTPDWVQSCTRALGAVYEA